MSPGKINFLENKPNVAGSGPEWLFDIDSLTKSMNYELVSIGNQYKGDAGIQTDIHTRQASQEKAAVHEYILLPFIPSNPPVSLTIQSSDVNVGDKPGDVNAGDKPGDLNIDDIQATSIFDYAFDDRDLGAEADTNNLDSSTVVSPIPTTRVHKDYPKEQIIRDLNLHTQTRRMINFSKETAMESLRKKGMKVTLLDTQCLSKHLGSTVPTAYSTDSQEPSSDARLISKRVANYEEKPSLDNILSLSNRFEDILGATSNSDESNGVEADISNMEIAITAMYQMDVKSAFLYDTIDEEVYVMQPPRFQDPEYPARVYKVEKPMYGLHQAPRAWQRGDFILVQVYMDDIIFGSSNPQLCREFEALRHEKFQMSAMGEHNFFLGLSSNTPMDMENPRGKDDTGKDVDLYLYRSMIGSLMYLTASRLDIMFVVCACARHQVTPKECHLHAVKRIYRYLKGHPKLGLWYPKDSPFDLVAYSDSDYGGATQDRKSTTGGCQFLGRRIISWQCKKQIIVAISTTEAEYVTAAR
nr:hypothetical protein [Tanacetum cinerariifolium]